jgi:hypothetical protein
MTKIKLPEENIPEFEIENVLFDQFKEIAERKCDDIHQLILNWLSDYVNKNKGELI